MVTKVVAGGLNCIRFGSIIAVDCSCMKKNENDNIKIPKGNNLI